LTLVCLGVLRLVLVGLFTFFVRFPFLSYLWTLSSSFVFSCRLGTPKVIIVVLLVDYNLDRSLRIFFLSSFYGWDQKAPFLYYFSFVRSLGMITQGKLLQCHASAKQHFLLLFLPLCGPLGPNFFFLHLLNVAASSSSETHRHRPWLFPVVLIVRIRPPT